MVRYSKDHKQGTRKAIVSGAADLFRKHGYCGVGINELCSSAGLTRGAFYAHFKSKAELFSAVLDGAHDMVKRLSRRKATSPEVLVRKGAQVARDYLGKENRQAVLGGCSLASLAMDTVRADVQSQAAYADAVERVVKEFCRDSSLPADNARAALALCVGGLLISSACGTNAIGDLCERSAQRHVTKLLTLDA